ASICLQQGGQQHEVQRPAAEWRAALHGLQPAIKSQSGGIQPAIRARGQRTTAVQEVSSLHGQWPPRDQRSCAGSDLRATSRAVRAVDKVVCG
ncbi:hypothetical protein Dimus_003627, partial [Dionaea muscipula]